MKKLFYLDTSVWLAYLDKNHEFHDKATRIFERILTGGAKIVISGVIDKELFGLGYYDEYREMVDKLYRENRCLGVSRSDIDEEIAYRYNEVTGVGKEDCLHIVIAIKHKAMPISFDEDWQIIGERFGFRISKGDEIL